jgi:hypothetical protein
MRTVPRERRKHRSGRADEALVFQLERVRNEAGLDALVLATAEGLPVAHSGEDELCVELAALAPFLHGDKVQIIAGEQTERPRTRVRRMAFNDMPLLLVSYRRDSPVDNDGWLEHASKGITRILSA